MTVRETDLSGADLRGASLSGVDLRAATLRGTRLDDLFDRWEATYAQEHRSGFHRDGAPDEPRYFAEPKRVLIVQKEPNSSNGAYDRF